MTILSITENDRVNNDQTHTTEAGDFAVHQRNQGYVQNDGWWTIHLLPELYWDSCGVLCFRRKGHFVGVFETTAEVVRAIVETELPELVTGDGMVR